MSESLTKQFVKLLSNSSHILILLPESPQNDFYSSALALSHYCDERNIQTTIAFSDPYEQMEILDFLPHPQTATIAHSIAGSRDLILSFDTGHNKILDVRTEKLSDKLNIYITPERGMIDSRDFSFMPAKFPYDLIITVGASDKESMGRIYDEIPDVFYEVPIMNIDNNSANEQFGQVNIVNTVASSVSEIIGDLFEQIDGYSISSECAQPLLTGIISATNSFQNHNTSPHALTLSSKLLEYGADQQKIIKNLYRNQSFSLLQLWGKAMKNLTTSKHHNKIVITSFTQNDLKQTNAGKHHVHEILKKMKQNYPSGKIFVIICEHEPKLFSALIDTQKANIALTDNDQEFSEISSHVYEVQLDAKEIEIAKDEIDAILLSLTEQLK